MAKKTTLKLDQKAFAITCGAIWGVGMFALGIAGMYGWGATIVNIIGSVYKGFAPTLGGSVAGGIWGFIDGAIGGYIFAWLYNKLAK